MTQPPFFFTSYAVRRADSALVQRFHDRLQDEVEMKRARTASREGFLDVGSLKLGENWRPRLSRALGSTRFLVALLSDDYFEREWCGREWAVMAERVRRAAPAEPVALLPLFWVPVTRALPDEVAAVQYRMPRLGAAYTDDCLVNVMRGDPRAYEKFVIELADYMVQASATPLPVMDGETAGRFAPAFGLPARTEAAPGAGTGTRADALPDGGTGAEARTEVAGPAGAAVPSAAAGPASAPGAGDPAMSGAERRRLIELILASDVCRGRDAWDVYVDSVRELTGPRPLGLLSDGGQLRTRVVALVNAALRHHTPALVLAVGEALADQTGEEGAEEALRLVTAAAARWPRDR
ncbi:TIR domain-containing protein [Streptomyces sp. NPDC008313]|uniref:TIR domain-containing protein n=1 Tax=Streptomyces sp. NPDC008313 TaxID=3364826 RepID=UPI0036EF80BC